MGSLDFFINIKIESGDANMLLQEYKRNALYQSAFHYGIIEEWLHSEFNAGISSVIDNFLPANILIYRFLSQLQDTKDGFQIETLEIQRPFDFENKSDFVNFMYNIWEEKIDLAYQQFGVIVIDHKQYYKIRNKLYKKYYIKF